MDRRIVWSSPASTDLIEVTEFIARDSRVHASGFARKVLGTARSLRRRAERGRRVPEFDDATIREVLVGNYRLIYRIESDRVAIVAFIHGARQLERLSSRF